MPRGQEKEYSMLGEQNMQKAKCEEQCVPCGTWKELRVAGVLWKASHLLRSEEAWQGKPMRSLHVWQNVY